MAVFVSTNYRSGAADTDLTSGVRKYSAKIQQKVYGETTKYFLSSLYVVSLEQLKRLLPDALQTVQEKRKVYRVHLVLIVGADFC